MLAHKAREWLVDACTASYPQFTWTCEEPPDMLRLILKCEDDTGYWVTTSFDAAEFIATQQQVVQLVLDRIAILLEMMLSDEDDEGTEEQDDVESEYDEDYWEGDDEENPF